MKGFSCLIISLFLVGSSTCQCQTAFTPNQGQWHDNVLFRTEVPGGSFITEEARFKYYFYELPEPEANHGDRPSTPEVLKTHAYNVHFEGANPENVAGNDVCENYKNYFKGNEKEKWAAKVHPVKKVLYEQLYAGVNLTLYSKPKRLKYDFEIEPEGDPSQIQLRYEGVENIVIENGNLIVTTSVNTVTEHRPFSYQTFDGVTNEIDSEDNIVILGNTGSSDLPTSEEAFSQSLMGGPQVELDFVEGIGLLSPDGVDLFVTKIVSDGSLAASTYFEGSNTDGINQYGKLFQFN